MEAFTVRNVSKFVVYTAVQQKTASVTKDTITDYTRYEEDDMIVGIGAATVGWFVADKLKPHTDKLVDKTADFINEKRAARAAKKTTEKED